jgi:hypothetical protein
MNNALRTIPKMAKPQMTPRRMKENLLGIPTTRNGVYVPAIRR